jgi:hypothetical protein
MGSHRVWITFPRALRSPGITVLLMASLLCGCSVWPRGQDPNSLEYRRAANQVMTAVQNYRRDKGTYPLSLSALVTAYLNALPDGPELRYDPANGSMTFDYRESWPQLHHVTCRSRGATTEWRCA